MTGSRISHYEFERPFIVAHRGASALAPENTLSAYTVAVEAGADFIELDLNLSKDGHLICMHDSNVERTTNGSGEIASLTLDELKRLDAGSWFYGEQVEVAWTDEQLAVPVLDEVLDLIRGRCSLLIELKKPEEYPGIEESLTKTLRDRGMTDAVIVQSFVEASVRKMAEVAPEVPRFQLTSKAEHLSPDALEAVHQYAHGIAPKYPLASREVINAAHSRDLVICPWTVNSAEEMSGLLDRGVNGIITDNPVTLKRAIAARSS